MKKRKLFILLIILIFINILFNLYSEYRGNLIGKSIFDTGATFNTTSLSITVDANAPDVFIIHPQNKTYRTNMSLPLNYSVSDRVSSIDSIWYNLDRGNNISLIGNTTFNTSEGSHTLYLFANDTKSYLNNSESVTFFINTTNNPPTLIQNIPNLTWNEDTSTTLNLTQYFNDSDNDDLTYTFTSVNDIAITVNNAGIATFTPESNFFGTRNTTATANDSIAATNSNLFYLTVNDVAEPSAPGGSVGGGGGGGGGTEGIVEEIEEIENFEVEPEILKVSLKQGETKRESIKIKNIGDEKLDININLESIKDFVLFPSGLSTQNFELQPGEEKTIQLVFSIEKDQIPDLYVKNLIITTDSKKKIVKTIIEVESLAPIFDVKVEIPQEFLEIAPGKDLLAQINIFNVKGIEAVDVHVIYTIKDMEGNIILEEDEYLAVETKTSLIKRLRIPSNLEEGNYVLYVKVEYDNTVGSTSALFSVSKRYVETPLKRWEFYTIIVLVIILIFGILFYFEYKKDKQLKRLIKSVTEKDLSDKGLIKRR